MAYASLNDLIERAGEAEIRQIADRDRDGVPDADVVAAALVHADNVIDGYVGTKYDLPLTSTPDILRTWATSIARYYLHRNGAPDYVTADQKDAIAGLKDVARGLIGLPTSTGVAPPANSGSFQSDIPDPHFSTLRGWLC